MSAKSSKIFWGVVAAGLLTGLIGNTCCGKVSGPTTTQAIADQEEAHLEKPAPEVTPAETTPHHTEQSSASIKSEEDEDAPNEQADSNISGTADSVHTRIKKGFSQALTSNPNRQEGPAPAAESPQAPAQLSRQKTKTSSWMPAFFKKKAATAPAPIEVGTQSYVSPQAQRSVATPRPAVMQAAPAISVTTSSTTREAQPKKLSAEASDLLAYLKLNCSKLRQAETFYPFIKELYDRIKVPVNKSYSRGKAQIASVFSKAGFESVRGADWIIIADNSQIAQLLFSAEGVLIDQIPSQILPEGRTVAIEFYRHLLKHEDDYGYNALPNRDAIITQLGFLLAQAQRDQDAEATHAATFKRAQKSTLDQSAAELYGFLRIYENVGVDANRFYEFAKTLIERFNNSRPARLDIGQNREIRDYFFSPQSICIDAIPVPTDAELLDQEYNWIARGEKIAELYSLALNFSQDFGYVGTVDEADIVNKIAFLKNAFLIEPARQVAAAKARAQEEKRQKDLAQQQRAEADKRVLFEKQRAASEKALRETQERARLKKEQELRDASMKTEVESLTSYLITQSARSPMTTKAGFTNQVRVLRARLSNPITRSAIQQNTALYKLFFSESGILIPHIPAGLNSEDAATGLDFYMFVQANGTALGMNTDYAALQQIEILMNELRKTPALPTAPRINAAPPTPTYPVASAAYQAPQKAYPVAQTTYPTQIYDAQRAQWVTQNPSYGRQAW